MNTCRECFHKVSEQATTCPNCGAPYPAREHWDGWGFEYKSQSEFMGWPLLHISFKYRPNRMPVPARGIIAIGQFSCGGITLSQFGIGAISISQFALGGYALAQFGVAYSLVAQFGLYVDKGYGQVVKKLSEFAGLF